MSTTLSKIYPRLDKICDANFIKKVIGTTKKDSVIFINDSERCQSFFQEKEEEMERHNEIIRNDIVEFFQTNEMQHQLAKFKSILKEKTAKEKARKRELEKEAIIEEYLREKQRAERDSSDRERLGMPAKDEQPGKVEASVSSSSVAAAPSAPAAASSPPPEEIIPDESTMHLEDFLKMFQEVYDQGFIVVKHGATVMQNVNITLDEETQKIIIQSKVSPVINLKKN